MKVHHLTSARASDASRRSCAQTRASTRPQGSRRGWLALLSSSWLSGGCTPTVGPLFTSTDAGRESAPQEAAVEAPAAGDGGRSERGDAPVRQSMRLQYQLVGPLDQQAEADLFVVDLFETASSAIEQLHGRGRVVIAFIAAGSYEPWRPDVRTLPASAIGAPLAGYPNEAWLDVRAGSVRQLMSSRLTMAADKGFDGVLLVSLDGYLTQTGHDLTSDDQLDYNLWLARQARQRGLVAGISSDWAHATKLADDYDFAIHLNCLANRRCAELTPYRERGQAVFDLETRRDASTVCAEAADLAMSVTLKNDTFDAWLVTCR